MPSFMTYLGIEGAGDAYIEDVVNEVKPNSKNDKLANIMTDDIEEKDTAIQMLIFFVEVLGLAASTTFSKSATSVNSSNLGRRRRPARACEELYRGEPAQRGPDALAREAALEQHHLGDGIVDRERLPCVPGLGHLGDIKEIVAEAGPGLLQPLMQNPSS